jgi:hypothetical protein
MLKIYNDFELENDKDEFYKSVKEELYNDLTFSEILDLFYDKID